MKCKQCGAEIKNDEKFCRICGARLPVETEAPASDEAVKKPETKPKKSESKKTEPAEPVAKQEKPEKEKKPFKLPKKVIIIAAIVAVAIVAAVIAILLLGGGGSSELSLDPNRPFVVEYVDKAVVYAADGTALASVDDCGEVRESVWNSTIALRRGSVDEAPFGGSLTIVANGAASVIDETVCDVVVSADGSRVAYIARAGGLGDGDLYTYDVESGESTFIDSDVIVDTVVLSPDGTRLAYNIFDAASDCEHTLVGKSTKEGERLLDCERMYALSNDGVYTYFTNNGRLYVETDGERERLSYDVDHLPPLYTNSVGSELLYLSDSGVYCSFPDAPISPNMLTRTLDLSGILGFMDEQSETDVHTVRADSFKSVIVDCGGELINADGGSVHPIADSISAVGSENGRKVAYIDMRGNICVSDGDATSGEFKQVRPDETPTELFADAKLSRIYFTNDRGELWRLNGDKTEMVSAHASNICMSESGTLYFLYDGVVLCRADGSERVSLGRMEDFLDIESAPQGAVVKLRSGDTIYYRDDSTEGIALSTTVTVTNTTEVE